jgi:hypothetical protein
MVTIMRMDSFTPVIVIEGFLAFGVVLLLYFLHVREMRQIKAKKALLEQDKASKTNQRLSSGPHSSPPVDSQAEKNT